MGKRRPSKHLRTPRPLSAGFAADLAAPAGWVVRRVSGAGATKEYRCPGCNRVISPGTAHLVAWRAERSLAGGGPEDRRHWHNSCWQRLGPR